MIVDVAYDLRKDTKTNDPDAESKILKKYHQLLWSKSLPNGTKISLSEPKDYGYLFFHYHDQDFMLSSDIIITTYTQWKRCKCFTEKINDKIKMEFDEKAHTIGSFILFPQNKINRLPTINMERGTNASILDRFDLTLECIRLHYLNEENPLKDVLNRYKYFFDLFGSFENYCQYFLLDDLVDKDYNTIRYFLTLKNSFSNPLPGDETEYIEFFSNAIDFIKNRNKRIQQYVESLQ
jgi:hypothetical protein